MDRRQEALDLVQRLHGTALQVRQAVLQGEVQSLPELARQEAELAARLAEVLGRRTADADPQPEPDPELRERARAWWRLHQQNRLLLQHAHQTVVALIELLAGAVEEPAGLYAPAGAGSLAAAGRPVAAAVDRKA